MFIKRSNCFSEEMKFFFLIVLYLLMFSHTALMLMLIDYKFYVGL